MKKYIKNIINTIRSTFEKTSAVIKTNVASKKLAEQNGQFVMDHTVVFIIIIVLGALAITLLVTYLQGDLSTLLKGKINALFN